MATKDISDLMVLQAYIARDNSDWSRNVIEILMDTTGECLKVCWRAMERTCDRGLLDYGVSLRAAWLTDKGKNFLKESLDTVKS